MSYAITGKHKYFNAIRQSFHQRHYLAQTDYMYGVNDGKIQFHVTLEASKSQCNNTLSNILGSASRKDPMPTPTSR